MNISQAFALTGRSINWRLALRSATILASAWLFVQLAQISSGPSTAQASAPPSGAFVNPVAPDDLDADYKSVDARSIPAGHCRVKDSELSSVPLGANYADVVYVFGCAGTITSSKIVDGIKFHVLAWNDGQVLALFVNGRLSITSQSGPR
ncbi:hypothetical protein CQ12_25265 [Bradyrhizobium jicamae]|uniref:Uncharacterized protein n=1 Tax=Bradyrhizobium jicamae TaxID=280332 RepID=A0A0R3LJF8_9BRAD|nr:hypothetical protein CQ12_25265 [Bradyrhizobium jicamae]